MKLICLAQFFLCFGLACIGMDIQTNPVMTLCMVTGLAYLLASLEKNRQESLGI